MGQPRMRFFVGSFVVDDNDCWRWNRSLHTGGYAQMTVDRKTTYAHRWSYETFVGPIPEELDIDHLCRVRNCVNPRHLEPVTRRENLQRSPIYVGTTQRQKTHCPQGHPYDEQNTYRIPGRAHRLCRECRRVRNRDVQRRARDARRVSASI